MYNLCHVIAFKTCWDHIKCGCILCFCRSITFCRTLLGIGYILKYCKVRQFGGKDQPIDLEKAVKIAQEAADQGNPTAQALLGFMYATGTGVPHDEPTVCFAVLCYCRLQ